MRLTVTLSISTTSKITTSLLRRALKTALSRILSIPPKQSLKSIIRLQEKSKKSPVTIGSTVYLEDARPFTVEEISRENIHLRDESFPLVGRAVSHEEFARLLAANPKNAALSAPEVPSRQEQPEETAEPIVGEVIEEPNPFVAQVMADAERLSAEDEPYHREPITYEAPYLDNLPTAQREKFAANIAAIQKLKEIE